MVILYQILYFVLAFKSYLPVPVVMTCLPALALFDLFACPDCLHTANCKPASRQAKDCFFYTYSVS